MLSFQRLLAAALTIVFSATLALAAPQRLVVLGDSLSAGYRLPADAAFPAVLEKALRARGHNATVVNAGVSGDTASGGLERLDWAIGGQVAAVIVELGANDMLRGIDPTATQKALDAILTRLAEEKIPVLLAGMVAAPGLGAAYERAFNDIYPTLAQKHGALLYPFFLDGVAQQPGLMLEDGMHPNRAGVEEIVRRILPLVEDLLKRAARAG